MAKTLFHDGMIQTFTGRPYDFANPDPAQIDLDDIAHALANACRFAGHVKRFYSVAEHCVRVSELLERWGVGGNVPLYGLLHDAHEAYVWDCPRPFKPLLGKTYEQFAEKADEAIAAALLNYWDRPVPFFKLGVIKEADNVALCAEARTLLVHPPETWIDWEKKYKNVPAPPEGIFPPRALGWSPNLAEEAFHVRATEVGLCE
jgi:hypothetical protein